MDDVYRLALEIVETGKAIFAHPAGLIVIGLVAILSSLHLSGAALVAVAATGAIVNAVMITELPAALSTPVLLSLASDALLAFAVLCLVAVAARLCMEALAYRLYRRALGPENWPED